MRDEKNENVQLFYILMQFSCKTFNLEWHIAQIHLDYFSIQLTISMKKIKIGLATNIKTSINGGKHETKDKNKSVSVVLRLLPPFSHLTTASASSLSALPVSLVAVDLNTKSDNF